MWKCLKHSKSTGAYPRPSSLCCYKHALTLKPSDKQFNSNLWPQHFSVILQQWRSEIAAPSSPPQCWGEAMLSKHRCLSGGCLLPKSLFFFVVELTHSPSCRRNCPQKCWNSRCLSSGRGCSTRGQLPGDQDRTLWHAGAAAGISSRFSHLATANPLML